MRLLRTALPPLALWAALALASTAGASETGGATAPAGGGTAYGEAAPTRAPAPQGARGRRPVLELFELSRRRLYLYGRPVGVRFRIRDGSRRVRVRLSLRRPGARSATRRLELGRLRTGVTHVFRLTGREGGRLGGGRYELRLSARDGSGNRLRRPGRRARWADGTIALRGHRFPIVGRFSWGGAGSRFGAGRSGHRHQGQDLAAPSGTPVVAPRGGRVEYVRYQAGGAGYYVVLDGAGEDRDYVFMHLRAGSIRVREGQRVRTGKRLADVGNTGGSSGAHLHFEIWVGGGWYAGGRPIDPFPHLRRWNSWS